MAASSPWRQAGGAKCAASLRRYPGRDSSSACWRCPPRAPAEQGDRQQPGRGQPPLREQHRRDGRDQQQLDDPRLGQQEQRPGDEPDGRGCPGGCARCPCSRPASAPAACITRWPPCHQLLAPPGRAACGVLAAALAWRVASIGGRRCSCGLGWGFGPPAARRCGQPARGCRCARGTRVGRCGGRGRQGPARRDPAVRPAEHQVQDRGDDDEEPDGEVKGQDGSARVPVGTRRCGNHCGHSSLLLRIGSLVNVRFCVRGRAVRTRRSFSGQAAR